jgi:hypothetical protein
MTTTARLGAISATGMAIEIKIRIETPIEARETWTMVDLRVLTRPQCL